MGGATVSLFLAAAAGASEGSGFWASSFRASVSEIPSVGAAVSILGRPRVRAGSVGAAAAPALGGSGA